MTFLWKLSRRIPYKLPDDGSDKLLTIKYECVINYLLYEVTFIILSQIRIMLLRLRWVNLRQFVVDLKI